MKAVVLAAGEGRRLRPLTGSMSKGMLPVANRPILGYVIEALSGCDIREILLVVGYQKEKVMNYFGDGKDFGVDIKYVHQKFQLGTGHALQQARNMVDGSFLMVPGDSLVDVNGLKSLIALPEGEWGMLTTQTSNSSKYGLVEVSGDKLKSIHEKPKLTEDLISTGTPSIFALALWEYQDPGGPSLINTGTYRFDSEIFGLIDECGDPPVLTSCLSKASTSRRISIVQTDRWLDAVYPWDILPLNEYVLGQTARTSSGIIEDGVVLKGNISMGPQVKIKANSVLEGPIVIGGGTTLGPGTYVGPNTSIGENCHVGPFSVVRNSIVMDDTIIGSHSSIANSVIANGSSLSDFFGIEQGEYSIKLENHSFSKTIGAIVGPDCEISHHVSLSPGVILGSKCKVGPMRSLKENLPNGTNAV
ncbi:MAG: sugar phosphate nucleotidyltransferase [Thermoplasmatota archaeon]